MPVFHAIMFCLGVLSMGFQIVASRVLAPAFGTSIVVWSFLIATFLIAFSLGSFLGGSLCSGPRGARRSTWITLAALATVGFAVNAFLRGAILSAVEARIESLEVGMAVACALLFLLPIVALSSLTPLCVQFHAQRARGGGSGRSAGVIYGVSTLGNIVGVMGTALLLVPRWPVSTILLAWTVFATLILSLLCVVASSPLPSSSPEAPAR